MEAADIAEALKHFLCMFAHARSANDNERWRKPEKDAAIRNQKRNELNGLHLRPGLK